MEIIIVLAIAATIIWWVFFRKRPEKDSTPAPYKIETPPAENKIDPVALALDLEPMIIAKKAGPLDVNQDGKVNVTDLKETVKKTRSRVKKAADVDGDGRVTVKDAKAAVKKATRGRKPKSKTV